MRKNWISRLLPLLLLAIMVASAPRGLELIRLYQDTKIIPLNSENFHEVSRASGFSVIYMYYPWCFDCKSLTKEYISASRNIAKRKLPIVFYAVDCVENEEVSSKLRVDSFPSIVLLVRETPVLYLGSWDSNSIIEWVLQKVKSPSTEFKEAVELERAIKNNRAVMAFIGDLSESEFKVYSQVAQSSSSEMKFMHSKDKEIASRWGSKFSSEKEKSRRFRILLFRAFDSPFVEYHQDSLTLEDFKRFLSNNRYELLMPFTNEEAVGRIFYEEGTSLIFMSSSLDSEEQRDLVSLSLLYKPSIKFFHSSIDGDLGRVMAEYLDISDNSLGQVWLIDVKEEDIHKYKLYNTISVASITNFINRFLSGRINADNSMVSDDDIILDLNRKIVVDFSFATKHHIIFHYNKSLCRPDTPCSSLLQTFLETAKALYFITEIEFCYLDYDFLYSSINNGKNETRIIINRPILSVFNHLDKTKKDTENSTFKIDVISTIIENDLKIPTGVMKYLEFKKKKNTNSTSP